MSGRVVEWFGELDGCRCKCINICMIMGRENRISRGSSQKLQWLITPCKRLSSNLHSVCEQHRPDLTLESHALPLHHILPPTSKSSPLGAQFHKPSLNLCFFPLLLALNCLPLLRPPPRRHVLLANIASYRLVVHFIMRTLICRPLELVAAGLAQHVSAWFGEDGFGCI